MQADVPTLITNVMLVSLTVALVMVVVGWHMPREGLRVWATALAIQAGGYWFFLQRQQMDESLSIVLSNGLTALSFALLMAAVRRFYGLSGRWLLMLSPPVVLSLLLATLNDFHERVLLANSVFALQLGAIAITLFIHRKTTAGLGKWLVMAGMTAQALVLAWRAGLAMTGALKIEAILQPGSIQTATFFGAASFILVTSLGFIFMTKDRADEANRLLAAADSLTGVANRRSIIAALDRDVSRAIRTREPIAVMMIDLDHFKSVNDAHGHLAGDAVLRGVVRLIDRRIRSQDIIGRYGGEEFLVVLPDTMLSGANRLAQELCVAVATHPFIHGNLRIPLTVSIGVFGGRLEPGDSWDALIHAADSALYNAKNSGCNRMEYTAQLPRSDERSGPETFPASML